MDRDVLLDAIGMVDDRFLTEEPAGHVRHLRRFTVLVAAVVAVLAMTLTAMAVSQDFRETIFSIFRIQTPETPPVTEPTQPAGETTEGSQPNLREMGVVDIDGEVEAFYFSSAGYVMQAQGGFLTTDWPEGDEVPGDPAFWEITEDGIVAAEGARVDFPLTHGGKTFRIVFDWAVLNGSLCTREWPQGLDQDPYGNGWSVERLGDRTDAVVLSIPVNKNKDYTHDYFLLDLNTLEITLLLDLSTSVEWMADCVWFTDDLEYAIICGYEKETVFFLHDMETGRNTRIDELVGAPLASTPYFQDNETLIYWEALEGDRISVVRYHIPTGTHVTMVEDVARQDYRSVQHSGWASVYGILSHGAGEYELIDLRTNARLYMSGLPETYLSLSESPNAARILVSWKDSGNYPVLGLLDPETGVLKMLTREATSLRENFWGWLDDNTVVLTAMDEAAGGYYVYVYRFQ